MEKEVLTLLHFLVLALMYTRIGALVSNDIGVFGVSASIWCIKQKKGVPMVISPQAGSQRRLLLCAEGAFFTSAQKTYHAMRITIIHLSLPVEFRAGNIKVDIILHHTGHHSQSQVATQVKQLP